AQHAGSQQARGGRDARQNRGGLQCDERALQPPERIAFGGDAIHLEPQRRPAAYSVISGGRLRNSHRKSEAVHGAEESDRRILKLAAERRAAAGSGSRRFIKRALDGSDQERLSGRGEAEGRRGAGGGWASGASVPDHWGVRFSGGAIGGGSVRRRRPGPSRHSLDRARRTSAEYRMGEMRPGE